MTRYLIFLSVFSIPFYHISSIAGVRITTTELLFSIALSSWLFSIFRSKDKMEFTPLAVPIMMFLGACMISIFEAQNKFIALRETLQFVWLFWVYYFIFNFFKDTKKLQILLILTIGAGIIVSIIGLYQYFFITEPFHFRISDNRLRAYATFGQPNAFGNYLIGIIPIVIGFCIAGNKRSGKNIALASLFIISLALFATFSRGSWIGLVSGVVLMFVIVVKKPSIRFSLILPSLVVLAFGSIILGDIYLIKSEIKSEIVDRESNRQRVLLAKSALDMVVNNPIKGVGIGNYPVLLPQYATWELKESLQVDYNEKVGKWFVNPDKKIDVEIVHNMFLQVSAETGLIGLAAFLWLLYAYFKSSLKLVRTSSNDKEKVIRAGLIGSATAVLASGLFGWPFSHGVQEILILSMALSTSPWKFDEGNTS